MTRVDFYFNAGSKLGVARQLAGKAYKAGQHTLLYTMDEKVARELDSGLWVAEPLSFLPHVRCGHPLANRTPILIGDNPEALASPDLLVNLSDAWPPFFSRFERLIEVVTQDEDDRQRARERWQFYKQRGYALDKVDLAGRG